MSAPQENAMTTIGYLRAAREWAYPTLKKSAFLEKGVLTPEEFVVAGDELVFRCPTWSWETGDRSKIKAYLPADKQYLVTRQVPCVSRVAELEHQMDLQQLVGDDDDTNDGGLDGEWLVSHMKNEPTRTVDADDDFDIVDERGEIIEKVPAVQASTPANVGEVASSADEEYADMADFEDDNVLTDDAAVVSVPVESTSGNGDNVLRVRTYDLSITYDKYYQTPRVWMVGRTANGQPLSGPQMLEDVMSDYANKTVTIEGHPHVAGPHASIHPCQHGKVMKTIVRNLIRATDQKKASTSGESASEGPSVEMYLFIFLKFVSSIIPTMNYDFTMEVNADTRK
jgi:ubiquitin-like-conjugating enzyme ATG3